MNDLERLELKIDCMLKCFGVIKDGEEKTMFDVATELIKAKDDEIVVEQEKTVIDRYKESVKDPVEYLDKLIAIMTEILTSGKKLLPDSNGYFIYNDRVFNIDDYNQIGLE